MQAPFVLTMSKILPPEPAECALMNGATAPLTFVTWPERRIDNITSLLDALASRVGDEDNPRRGDSLRVGEVLAVVRAGWMTVAAFG